MNGTKMEKNNRRFTASCHQEEDYIYIYNLFIIRTNYESYEDYKLFLDNINKSENIVDLGCGSSPHPKSKVAVDKYIEPIHRKFGANQQINVASIESRGTRFVQADFENLPFEDNQFDFAYSHHVVEHLDNPALGLKEMMRVAKRGVIICPGPLAEYVFGRKYHKWVVTKRANLIIFIEKDWQGLLFGEGPHRENGKVIVPKDCNPFDILLNDGHWYHGLQRWKLLSSLLRKYWYGHHPCMETVFNWDGSFEYLIIWKNGAIERS